MTKQGSKFIPVCEPYLSGNEKKYVLKALRTNWISSQGEFIPKFEEKFAEYCGCKYGIAVMNGTVALHLAYVAAGIKAGDEVICPAFTMISPLLALQYIGAKPVLVDADGTWTIDTSKIEEKITPNTKAILAVHIYGHPCNMPVIQRIAKKNNLLVIEDAAEAHGAKCFGIRCGGMSDVACFSFYANKVITTGEGGMVVTNNEAIAKQCQLLRNLAFTDNRYLHEKVGFNYRITNLQAAIGLAQVEKIEEYVYSRRRNAKYYNSILSKIKGIVTPIEAEWAESCYWMYGILVNDEFGINRDELAKRLKEKGIGTRNFFIGMHRQPIFPELAGEYPMTDILEERGLYLPSSTGLTAEQQEYICREIKNAR